MTDGYQPDANLEANARKLLDEDRVMDGAKSLSMSLRCSAPLRVTQGLLAYLLDHCCRHQYRQVAYLFEEFAASLPPKLELPLRIKQHTMFQRFNDVDGIAMTIRRID